MLNSWRIRQNYCLLELAGWEVLHSVAQLLAAPLPACGRTDWPSLLSIHYPDCSGMLYSQLGSEPRCATYPTNAGKTLTLSWENTRKTTESFQVIASAQMVDANDKIPGKTICPESFHYEFQYNCLLVWSSFEALVISLPPLFQLLETYGVEVTAFNS